ncbi:MAG: fused MFS/spermidine synthase [Myroides sp.]
MSILKKYFSYLNVIPERTYQSTYNGVLEINWLNGKKILDTKNTNYSYGNLGKVLQKGLKSVTTDFRSEETSILILGLGGGDVVKQLRNNFKSHATITAVEIDPVVIEIALKEFDIIPNSKLEIVNNDANVFLKYSKERYNLIIVDLFNDVTIPDFVFQPEFIKSVYNVLDLNGSIIFNTFILSDVHKVRNKKFVENLKRYFSVEEFANLYGHNHLIITKKVK